MESQTVKTRPPIVVVVGHVDHGKTALLDYVRKTNVVAREAGGITQSIGAYEIIHPSTSSGQARKITFIDTPGHEAFSRMRATGAEVADLAVLVIAADEGVKQQTKEAIKTLNETKTPFVVALNKVDKQDADLEKTKNELTSTGVFLEGYGGQTSYQAISAKTGQGVNELLDLVILVADVEHLTYDPAHPASGYILEAKLDSRRGFETIAILKDGTLRSGDFVATKTAKGKIKILENFRGERAERLEPSAPARIIGLENLPRVGEIFFAGESEQAIRDALGAAHDQPSSTKQAKERGTPPKGAPEGEKRLRLLLKATDAGSLEALATVIKNLGAGTEPVVLQESVGDINDSDVKTGIAGQAAIIGFRTKVNQAAKKLAEVHGVRIVTSDIIYDLVKAIEELLKGPAKGAIQGELEILAVFNQKKLEKQVVGGRVMQGILKNKAEVEIRRGEEIIGKGRLLNLQQQKKDAATVEEGKEAGLLVNSQTPIQVGDRLLVRT